MKICENCNKEYKPSSRHRICPKCRGRLSKVECSCGKLKQRLSPVCIECSIRIRSEIGYTMPRGQNSHNWKGGRVTSGTNGYVRLRAPEDHPRTLKSRDYYVLEHILVMESKLGRYLLPGENVHHRNGIRDDNRIENLELWTKSPMAGIRATDAVLWAKEILKVYGTPRNANVKTKIIKQVIPVNTSKGYIKKGYIMMMAPEGHPNKSKPGKTVFEHILVMENQLGRYLLPGENVHHLNGIKDDNRLENLELWTKPQPSGIRAEDAVTWAIEILNRYDSL